MPRPVAAPVLALALAALAGCAAPRPVAPAVPGAGATPAGREVLLRFARAVEGGRWDEAWPLLSSRWRAATSPRRLAADFRDAGPVAREAVERVVAMLADGAPLGAAPGQLRLAVGPGRWARLVEEPGGWRVDALE
jgi:hypothetical protein